MKFDIRKPEEFLSILVMSIIIILMFVEIIFRYVFNSSLIWSEELSRYLFVWFVYISMSYAVYEKAHIKIESLALIIPERIRIYFSVLGNIVLLAFLGVICYLTMMYSINMFEKNTFASATNVPMGLVYIGLPLGFALSIIRIVQELFNNFKSINKSRH